MNHLANLRELVVEYLLGLFNQMEVMVEILYLFLLHLEMVGMLNRLVAGQVCLCLKQVVALVMFSLNLFYLLQVVLNLTMLDLAPQLNLIKSNLKAWFS